MRSLGLNHMTMPHASTVALLDTAQALGCQGVELRNDLAQPLFDGLSPDVFRAKAQEQGLRILALAEVYGFNDATPRAMDEVDALARLAALAGAEGVVLIPFISDEPVARSEQQSLLWAALTAVGPILGRHNMVGLIEPLGFAHASLRYKEDVAEALARMPDRSRFGLVHDTFHHALTGDDTPAPAITRVVHVSGVRRDAKPLALVDADRGLVDAHDRLGTLHQMAALTNAGFDGVFSIEAFAPEIHNLNNPKAALSASIAFMNDQKASAAA